MLEDTPNQSAPIPFFTVVLQSQTARQQRTVRQTFGLLLHSRTALAGLVVIFLNIAVYLAPGLEQLKASFAALSFAIFMVLAIKYAIEDTMVAWAEMRMGGTFRESVEQPVKAILEDVLPVQIQRSTIIEETVMAALNRVLPDTVQTSVDEALDEMLEGLLQQQAQSDEATESDNMPAPVVPQQAQPIRPTSVSMPVESMGDMESEPP